MNYIFTLSADDPDKYYGLLVFLESINKYYRDCFYDWQFIVITPKQFSNRKVQSLEINSNIQFLSLDSETFDNIYMYKTILFKYIDIKCKSNDLILYLDYDHICLSQIVLPQVKDGTIYLSSEIHSINSKSLNMPHRFPEDSELIHYNTSIIFSLAGTFLMAAERWCDYGKELLSSSKLRNSEEIAFTLSAKDGKVDLLPISSSFQSNWANLKIAPLFHYGGSSAYTRVLKNILNSKSLNISNYEEARDSNIANPIADYYYAAIINLIEGVLRKNEN